MATSEDLNASDEIQESEATLSDDLNCPLCMKIFRSPRRLPCLHSFCHDCLQSHIYNIAYLKDSVKVLCCPLCGNLAFTGESSTNKLVHLFPLNTLMLSALMKSKVKIDLVCNACQAHDFISPAENLCNVCEEALCIQCSKMHGMSRLSTSHTILKIEDLPSKQQTVLQDNEIFRCTEHTSLPIEYYCKDHGTQLCAKCFVDDHANCPEVIKLANKTINISESLNQMKEQMKNLEDQLKQFAANNVLNLSKLESDINKLTTEIRTLKKVINDALDEQQRGRTLNLLETYTFYYIFEAERENPKFSSKHIPFTIYLKQSRPHFDNLTVKKNLTRLAAEMVLTGLHSPSLLLREKKGKKGILAQFLNLAL
ncbi:hypothetical protein ACJMK2_000908 [Sinanodonta woodiana]|uniref:Uncharacterized protein n=1 Tax=Sinanodonta woodiana TaxID=1069815 RepID=A0ABD3XQN6_SINWO